MNKLILTDCDGVLLNWEYAFGVWMERHGYKLVDNYQFIYSVHEKYDLDSDFGHELCRRFNESAMAGFIPALRDAVYYVKLLNEKHGYKFHVITSFSSIPESQILRKQNLNKIFGEEVFDGFTILGTGDDKDAALEPYRDTGLPFIEDKKENILTGLNMGLSPILMEHGHNMVCRDQKLGIPIVTNWKEVYEIITYIGR